MQVISNEYKNIIENKISFSPKSKIVVDGVEYLGDVIKSAPKFSHLSEKLFGTFPCKTCSFEIYNYLNNIDFENKEITIYKGIDINGNTEWIKQGIFIPRAEDITNNITTRIMSFNNIKDKTQLLEDMYLSELDWSDNQLHTGLEIIEEICERKSLVLKNNNFSWANIQMKQPNFSKNTTYREAVARLGEIGGEICLFDNNGELEIKSQYDTENIIPRRRYEKLSIENPFIINTVVLGNDSMDNDTVYPETILENRVEYKILDNPYVDLYKEEMIEEVARHIIGKSYTPFNLEGFVDGFFYELNDTVTIEDKNNNEFTAVFLGYSTTSRIKSTFKADVMSQEKTNYNLAGSNKKSLDEVRLSVNHIKGEIDSVVGRTDKLESDNVDIKTKFGNYTLKSDFADLKTSVEQIQTDTYTRTDIKSILKGTFYDENNNQIVSEIVRTTSGTFDENGMTYEKTNAQTKTTINETGINTKRTSNNETILFAGYVDDNNTQYADYKGQTIVATENILVKNYLVVGSKSRFEDYEDGTGCFYIG